MNFTLILSTIQIFLLLILIVAVFFCAKVGKLYFDLLKKHIDNSVQSKFIDISPSAQNLIEVATEVWRLEKRVGKITQELSDDQNKAFENSITKLKRFLDKNDITIADYTEQKYNDGLNLDVLSIEKDNGITDSIIKETHEPAIFHKGQLIKKAKVVILEK